MEAEKTGREKSTMPVTLREHNRLKANNDSLTQIAMLPIDSKLAEIQILIK
jgi:hypothetical protein